jgi:hypothetical protein
MSFLVGLRCPALARASRLRNSKNEDGRDAIIKVMACAIGGSDLHIFDGMILSYFWGMAALGAKRALAKTKRQQRTSRSEQSTRTYDYCPRIEIARLSL